MLSLSGESGLILTFLDFLRILYGLEEICGDFGSIDCVKYWGNAFLYSLVFIILELIFLVVGEIFLYLN